MKHFTEDDSKKKLVSGETNNKDSWILSGEDGSDKKEELDDMIHLVDLPEAVSDTESAEQEARQDVPDNFGTPPKREPSLLHKLRDKDRIRAQVRCNAAFMGRAFYEIGYYTEYALVVTGRALSRFFRAVGHGLLVALRFLAKVLLFLPKMLAMLLVRPAWHLVSACRNVHDIWYERDPDDSRSTWEKTFAYLGHGVRQHLHLLLDLLSWLLPVAAGFVFVLTVRTIMQYQYVLQVSYSGKPIGYVASEDICAKAQEDVQSRIVYTDGGSTKWSVTPTYELAVNDGVQLMNSEDVADAILTSSGEEIVEATGFYKDGVFYGATTDRTRLESELESLKAPYYTGAENETVSFVDEPQLVDGVYLRSSVVEYQSLSDLIHGQVNGEVNYTVVGGDTPSGIANDHGLTTAELYALNPELEGGNMYPGDVLVISQAMPFLQVELTYRTTEQEVISYDTIRTNTSDLKFGFTQVATQGQNGLNEVVYDNVYVDGILVSKTRVSTTVLSEPVTEEILVGTAVSPGVTLVPSSGGFAWPIPGFSYVSRGFSGLYAHNGMDICGGYGTPIYAAQSGVVTAAIYSGVGYGIHVIIDHGGGYSTLYGHCSGLAVSVGQVVNQGDLIAYVGSTGNSTGNHCHFEIRVNGVQVNPAPYVGYN